MDVNTILSHSITNSRTKTPVGLGTTRKPKVAKATRQPKPQVEKAQPTPCQCGCGSFPSRATSRFMPGHDGRLKGRLLAAVKAGSQDARDQMIGFGWGHFLPEQA